MADKQRGPDGPERPVAVPWPLAAGVIAGVLVVVFGFGMYANRSLRSTVAVLPTLTAEPRSADPAPSPAAPTVLPTPAETTGTPQPALAPARSTAPPVT